MASLAPRAVKLISVRPSRFSAEMKAKIVLRNLRGETQEALHHELGVARSTIKTWRRAFVEAGIARLRKPVEWHPSALDELQTMLRLLSEDTKDWTPKL